MAWEEEESTVVMQHAGARLEVALAGATVLRWSTITADGGTVELAAGYTSPAALERGREGAFAVMAPFVNRIRDGRYTFDGAEYDLRPAMHPADTEVMHGLVRRIRWQVDDVDTSGERARITLSTTIRAEDHPGYPFALDLQAVYTVGGHHLDLHLGATNVGPTTAPVVLGWHPYLAMAGHETVDGLTLSVPARTRVVVDDDLIPLPGDSAYQPVDGDGARWQPLGRTALDTSFLLPPGDRGASTWLRSAMTGRAVEVRQQGDQAPVMHVFTGDTLPGRKRTAIALEPVGSIADAFNRRDCAELVRLAPGDTRRLDVALVYHPDV